MWCGPKSCQLSAKGRGGCPSGQSCVPIREGHCFVRSCLGLGECWRSGPPPATPKCHPSSTYQDNSCANITLTFDKDTLPKVSGRGGGAREGGREGGRAGGSERLKGGGDGGRWGYFSGLHPNFPPVLLVFWVFFFF